MEFLDIEYKNGSMRRRFKNGNIYWYNKDGLPHRSNDRPAVVYSNGDKLWYKHGNLYRKTINQEGKYMLHRWENTTLYNFDNR